MKKLYVFVIIAVIAGIAGYCIGKPKSVVMTEPEKIPDAAHRISDIIEDVANTLKSYKGWNVEKFQISAFCVVDRKVMARKKFPAILVSYRGSSVDRENMTRYLRLGVVVATKDTGKLKKDEAYANMLAERAIALLDNRKYLDFRLCYNGKTAWYNSDKGISSYELSFDVEDECSENENSSKEIKSGKK